MRAIVFGADGLLGSHLVRQLLGAGHSVRACVAPGSPSPSLAGLPVERVEACLRAGGAAVSDAVRGGEVVFHAAAITDLGAPAELTWEVNDGGTERVISACLEHAVRRLVFVGSASSFAYGPKDAPGDERGEFPAAHRGVPYMESKRRATERVLEAVRTRGLDAVVVAPTFMLGDHDARPSSGELIRQFLLRRSRWVPGGGRSFAHAADVAGAAIAAADRARRGAVYVLAGANLTYAEFFARVAERVGLPRPQALPRGAAVGLGAAGAVAGAVLGRGAPLATAARLAGEGCFYDPSRAIRELGLRQTPVEQGIDDALRSLRRFGHLPQPYAGKVALVTGASRGVGFATARALAFGGADVVLTARGGDRLEGAVAALERLGARAVGVQGDVGCWEDAQRMVAAATDRFGRLDLVVNNAGVSMRGGFAELAPDVCHRTIATNLLGSVYVTRAAAPALVAARGSAVFVSSIAGLFGLPGASTYCASKAGLTGLCESLRLELGPQGVHVGVVHLGFTEHDPDKRILAGDGSLALPDRPAHCSQAEAAAEILALVAGRERRRVVTPIGKLGGAAYRLSPRLVERAIDHAQRSRWKLFQQFA